MSGIDGKLQSGIVYPEFYPISADDTVLNIGCGNGVQAVTYKGRFKKMIGVDINKDRLDQSGAIMKAYQISNFQALESDVEKIPLTELFDKILAIDIIEHVINPGALASEMYRLLKPGGSALITFPAMHDKWENLFRFIGRKVLRRKSKSIKADGWDPDVHQHDFSLSKWMDMMERAGFIHVVSRASTLFPPLHYLGIPKFWFTNRVIHRIDSFFCKLPVLKNYGQSLVCCLEKPLGA